MYLSGYSIFSMIFAFITLLLGHDYMQTPGFLGISQALGIMLFLVLGVLLLGFSISKIFNYLGNRNKYKPLKVKQPNIVVEFVKAKYNNYCPQITWK